MDAFPASPDEVHRFWFADSLLHARSAAARSAVWFGASEAFDREIRERFEPTVDAAARGELAAWETAPRSAVALVLVLDQFPRNAFRDTAAAYAHDEHALGVTRRALGAGHCQALAVAERAFLLMPFQHVEDLAAQREGLRLFERLVAEAAPEWRGFASNTLDYARRHLRIVERFGRFPHRNAVLGRTSTPAEQAYLTANPETFGQGGG